MTSSGASRGRTFVELMSHLERSMHEAGHVFPAVDHLAPPPPAPTSADAERIAASLSTEVSVELQQSFERWCACRREFADAAAELATVGRHQAESDYQSQLDREVAALRERRAQLLHAADELRACIARELDA